MEFALKLGYTEKLVQTALQKLGSSPDQNELLAELIKLGAVRNNKSGNNGSSCDNNIIIEDETNEQQMHHQSILRPIVIDGSNVAMR